MRTPTFLSLDNNVKITVSEISQITIIMDPAD